MVTAAIFPSDQRTPSVPRLNKMRERAFFCLKRVQGAKDSRELEENKSGRRLSMNWEGKSNCNDVTLNFRVEKSKS